MNLNNWIEKSLHIDRNFLDLVDETRKGERKAKDVFKDNYYSLISFCYIFL